MPCEAHISAIAFTFLFFLVIVGPCHPCLSVIISVSPIFTINLLILWFGIYSLTSPILIIWSPFTFHDYISLPRSYIQANLEHFCLLMLWKWVRWLAYTDPSPSPVAGCTGLHRRELPVLRYHKILVIYPYPFFGGNYPIVLLHNIINDCICIITSSPR